jgi:hypothetical protein
MTQTEGKQKDLDGNGTVPRQKLKAERVQDPLAAEAPLDGDGFVLPLHPGGVQGRLKAERVQQELQAMPGWRLAAGGKTIDRAKAFPNAEVARLYSGFVTAYAGALELPVVTSAAGGQVIVTLHAPRSHGRVGPLTESVLELARLLG